MANMVQLLPDVALAAARPEDQVRKVNDHRESMLTRCRVLELSQKSRLDM